MINLRHVRMDGSEDETRLPSCAYKMVNEADTRFVPGRTGRCDDAVIWCQQLAALGDIDAGSGKFYILDCKTR